MCSAGSCTVTVPYTAAAQLWTAPVGVSSAIFTVEGAEGGVGGGVDPGAGGAGDAVAGTIGLLPSEQVSVTVGGAGPTGPSGGAGGFDGGGAGRVV